MDNRFRKFYVDWFNIRKSTIYMAFAGVVFLAVLFAGSVWVWKNSWLIAPSDVSEGPRDSATITSHQGDVRVIRVSTRKTERARDGMMVQAGDTIQTQSDGRARVVMIDGSTLSVRPNSTVVIRDSSSIFGGKSVRVRLSDGRIRVRTDEQPENTSNVVEVKESENRIREKTDASFDLNRETNRGEIRIRRGRVVTSSNGVRTTLREDEYASLSDNGVSTREKLLRPPRLIAPPPSTQLPSGSSGRRSVMFSWKRQTGKTVFTYHMQLALSPFFVRDQMLYDKQDLSRTRESVSGIGPDTYFWRVRVASESGQKSEWSEPSKFRVLRRRPSKRIRAGSWSVDHLGGRLYRISGITEPGATISVAGRESYSKYDGSFVVQVSTSAGSVAITIFDDEGNRGRYNISLRSGRAVR